LDPSISCSLTSIDHHLTGITGAIHNVFPTASDEKETQGKRKITHKFLQLDAKQFALN
jgi:hypothetical protein